MSILTFKTRPNTAGRGTAQGQNDAASGLRRGRGGGGWARADVHFTLGKCTFWPVFGHEESTTVAAPEFRSRSKAILNSMVLSDCLSHVLVV